MAHFQESRVLYGYQQGIRPKPAPPSKKTMKSYASMMQSMIGDLPVVKVDKFRNWSRNQVRRRVLSVSPTSVDEVRAVIIAARQLGLRVRAAGQKHSWSPMFSDEGQVVLYTGLLRRPNGRPQIELVHDICQPGNLYATVAASATTGDFMKFQQDNNVCIPSNVVLRIVQMGGVISTGCHGVGSDVGAISEDIVSMRIINSSGQLIEYSIKTDPDMMKAVQCSLGLFGIIVDFTISIQPMVFVETQNIWLTVKDLFYNQQNLCNIVYGNWSVEIFWFPFNSITGCEAVESVWQKTTDTSDWDPLQDEVLVRLINKVQAYDKPKQCHAGKKEDLLTWIQTQAGRVVDGLVTNFPPTAPAFLKYQVPFLKTQLPAKTIERLPEAIHYRAFIQDLPVENTEWCFDLGKNCSALSVAIRSVVELVQQEAMQGRYPLNVALEMRFVGYSESYLAPMVCANPRYGGTGNSCFIELLALNKTPNWQQFCEQVVCVWRQLPGARPHWAKEWSFFSGIKEHFRKSYALQIPAFLGALQRSGADPEGTFLNEVLEEIFYPGGFPRGHRAVLLNEQDKESHCILL